MFCILKNKKIYPAKTSKHNYSRQKPFILWIIPNEEGWHYLSVKKPSALLGGKTFNLPGDLYCLNWLHFFTTENKRKSRKALCENKYFCNVLMLSEGIKILELTQLRRFSKAPYVIYANLECSIEQINGCKILKTHPQ